MESKVVETTILTGPPFRTMKSVDEMLPCAHSNKSYWTALSCGTVCYAVQGGSKALARVASGKTCDSVGLWLMMACNALRPLWSGLNLQASDSTFLTAWRDKLTQVGFSIVVLSTDARKAALKWHFATCVKFASTCKSVCPPSAQVCLRKIAFPRLRWLASPLGHSLTSFESVSEIVRCGHSNKCWFLFKMTLILNLSPDLNVNTFEGKRVIFIKLHLTADQNSQDN